MTVLALDPEQDKLSARAAELAEVLESGDEASVRLIGSDGESVPIPMPIFRLLRNVVADLKRGNGVLIMPLNKLLTTNQAADILNVSRPYLVKLLKEKRIPFEYVGSHRRIRLADLLEYRHERDQEREEALTSMVRRSEEAELPY